MQGPRKDRVFLLDGVDRQAYNEWRNSDCTKLLIQALGEDIADLTQLLSMEAEKASCSLDSVRSFGAQIAARRNLNSYIFERSDNVAG